MKQKHSLIKLSLLITLSPIAFAQSSPTATQTLQLSAFAGITGTFIDIEGGKNLGITAGADLTFLNLSRHFKPSIEIRGTYPIDDGHIASEKNFLGGVKVEYPVHRFHPYGDFFVGRGEIDYNNGGFIVIVSPTETLNYLSSNTTIYSPGGGLDYDISHTIALKADVQVQHWDVPVLPSGSAWATSLTFGAVYNFDFNPHRRYKQ
jgi:hypothetical protein